jgi:F-type H+-transporting ATPase subunit gamma
MPSGTRELKRRIKSVNSTKKITKAMEMVAAAKMRKAVNNVLATRDYSNLAWSTILHLADKTDAAKHPLLKKHEPVKRVAVLVISSNRGLCGGFNNNVAQKALSSIKKHEGAVENTEIITLGTKARDILINSDKKIAADFTKQDLILSSGEISAVARMLINDYRDGKYDKVMVAYTDFMSTIKQVTRVKQLLPIVNEQDEYLGVVGMTESVKTTKEFIKEKGERYLKKGLFTYEYIFEPSAETVLEEMLPRLIEMQIYQAVLESDASEHSARMMSMRNATDAAKDMIGNLTQVYNQARQSAITQEIAEISSGKAALEK